MRVSWNLNSQPMFQQATHFLGSVSWDVITVGHHLVQHAQSWMQPVMRWGTHQEEVPLFIKAQQEEKYFNYQTWRSDFKKQVKHLQQAIVAQYRQGVLVSPEHLRVALLAQHADFNADTVSPLYYTRHLKRLAQCLPRYAHTFEGVAAQFKDHLKAQPEKALRYFYNDAVNHLIDSSRDHLTITSEVRTALRAALVYYQNIVPTALYKAVQAIFADAVTQKTNQASYQDVLKQINVLFLRTMEGEAEEPVAITASAANTHALAEIQESLAAGWQHLKMHPKTVLWGVAATALSTATLYKLLQENAGQVSASWLDYSSSIFSFTPFASTVAASSLPVAMNYFMGGYAYRKNMPLWQAAVPLVTAWLSQLSPVTAQTERWAKTLGGAGSDAGYSVQQTMDGGYIATGSTASFGAGGTDLLLAKWTAGGTLSWAKTLGGTGSDSGLSVQQTADDGYIVTGSTASFGAGFHDLWLSKWAANGTLSWVKTLGGVSADFGYSVQQTADGGYIVVGITESFGAGYRDLWLSKWTSTGSLSWVKTLGGTAEDRGESVQQTTDGGYIVAGTAASFGGYDLWLSKWTSTGSLSWVKTLDGTDGSDDFGHSVQQTVDGGYIVTGSTLNVGADSELWLSKWTSSGTLSWAKTLGGMYDDYGNSVQQTADGGYVVTGRTNSFGAGSYDSWLSKWTSSGALSWAKILGGISFDRGDSVQQTTDGGYIVTGSTSSFGVGNSDLLLLKWDSQGTLGGDSCVSQQNVNSATDSVSAVNLAITPGTPTVSAQNVAASAQTISPTVLTSCNDAPVLNNNGGGFTYTENNPAAVIDSSITVSDIDNTVLSSASVSISSGFASDQDVLSFTNQNGITGNYNSTIGMLALSGTSSVANYQAALRAVTYDNLSDNPAINPRTLSFTVSDGQLNSNTVTRTATILAINDAPVLNNGGGGFTYTENDPAMVIDNSVTVSDIDSTNLTSASINISNGFANDQDILGFTNQNGITGGYNNGTGTLTLSGISSIANYQTALRSVTYQNTADNLSTNSRLFSFTVNDGALNSNTVTRTATIVAVNDAPVLNNKGGGFIYTENDPATIIDNNITIIDRDDTNLVSASVSISSGFAGEQDVLSFINQNGITSSSALGVLTLSGTSSVANYQLALRNVTYENMSDNPATNPRIFSFTVNDGEFNSNVITRTATVIAVNDMPVITHKQFTINQNETLALTNNRLQATDPDTPPANLQLIVSDIRHGYFDRSIDPNTAMTNFTQQEIDVGVISFVHDGSDQAPSFQISVSDGESTAPPVSATIDFIPRSEHTPFIPSFTASPQNNTALIAGLVSGAGALIIGVVGASYCYVKKRQQQAREQARRINAEAGIEMVSTVRQEKGYTVISGEHYHYALINKLKAKDAQALTAQTGIDVDIQGGKKAKLLLGQGKFGRLRLAKVVKVKTKSSDIAEQTYVGVKKIKGEKEIAASQAEASMQLKLKDKPHIMPLLDSVETIGSEGQKVLYQFMPLAGFGNGEIFQAHLAKVSDETHKQHLLVHVAKGLLTGLTHMHNNHIYHLDLKPSNVVLTPQGEVSIIDFGCAQQLPHQQLTSGNGDTRYFSPERLAQCRQQQAGETITSIDSAKVDAWAIGVTLLEMGINYYPWESKAAHERITGWDEAYFARQLKQVSALANPAPDSYWAVVKGLLDPHPTHRLTVSQALTALTAQRQYDFASFAAQQRAFQELKSLPAIEKTLSSSSKQDQEYAFLYLSHKDTGVAEFNTAQASYSSESGPHYNTSGSSQKTASRMAPTMAFFQPPKTSVTSTQPAELSLEERETRSAHYQPQG